jgi:lysophospholipase
LEDASYRADLAEGPDEVRAVWARTTDDVRLRVAVWPAARPRGTVLLFPGRTEYIEKYGRVARDLTAEGYTVAALDWRGQGLSDRLADDRLLGHVLRFTDYQHDVDAFIGVLDRMGVSGVKMLIAHSMGGCIGYRALVRGLAFKRAVFSSPMWGITIPASRKALAAMLPTVARLSGQGHRTTPGGQMIDYDSDLGFEVNPLTTDRDHFEYFARQLRGDPELALGMPSLTWLGEALSECRTLRGLPRPDVPTLIFAGSDETVVSLSDIERMHRSWPGSVFSLVDGARHELMMEAPAFRDRFFSETLAFLEGRTAA